MSKSLIKVAIAFGTSMLSCSGGAMAAQIACVGGSYQVSCPGGGTAIGCTTNTGSANNCGGTWHEDKKTIRSQKLQMAPGAGTQKAIK